MCVNKSLRSIKNMVEKKKERCVLTSVIETELDILKRHIHVLKTLKRINLWES